MRRVVWPGPQPKSRARSVDGGLKVGKEFACRRLECAGKDVKPALRPC